MSHPQFFSQRLSHTPLRGDGSAAVQYELSSHRIISSQDFSAWLHMNCRSRGSQWASLSKPCCNDSNCIDVKSEVFYSF